ncbi:putative ABC transport system permease protein [Oceanisphaera litoralis]|uniref:ABC transporter permease n=1 Tax=Oceanisphaera litoralis TaxID=225144 RepID=UPI00195BA1B8|nr:FtsX-like permease family protein [Oceanisphaera litoralis]MBM7457120.1 putative ABC transport system permease protein [Oceanisphaera litoralis]
MRLMLVALVTLLSHYRRHPGQLAMLLLGLWVAGALWSGVQAINASARDNYARAEALLGSGFDRLEREDGQPLSRDDFIRLRRAGVPVSPLLEGELVTDSGSKLTLIGIDPLTLPGDSPLARTRAPGSLQDFLSPPWQTRLAPDTRTQLGDQPTLQGGTPLPPRVEVPELPPNTLVMDIAIAARLLGAGDGMTALVSAADALTAAPDGFTLVRADTRADPGELTQSFHLNLTAMAMLALIVGLFIVQAALGLALEQRLTLLRTLRALGVSGRTLVALLVLELILLGLFGALAGLLGGLWLAKTWLPDVAATLHSLYGANIGGTLSLPWHYWLGGIGVTLGGLFIAGSGILWRARRLSLLGLGQAQAWRAGFQRQLRMQTRLGGVAALSALALGLWLLTRPGGEGLSAGFGLVAAIILAAALWLPPLLALVLSLSLGGLTRLARPWPLTQWALADVQLQLPRLSLAMMALLIALAANLGVSSMVGGFRLTFLDWLDRRLMADLYLTPPAAQFADIDAWLARRDEVEERLITAGAESQLLGITSGKGDSRRPGLPLPVFGITPSRTLMADWPLLATLGDRDAAWQALRHGQAFINEQLARGEGIALGDRLSLATPGGIEGVTVVGIYPDYGNPRGELVLATAQVRRLFRVPPASIGIVLPPGEDADLLRRQLLERFTLTPHSLRDQGEVKTRATAIFERTFAITRALNTLTLGVAALALLTTLLAQARERRRRMAALWALGVPLRRLLGIQLAQLAGVALVTGLLAIPLGIAITACLVWGINVAAFGWRLPLHVFPGEIGLTLITAVLVALLAAGLPMFRLWRTPPRALLAEEESA